MHKILIAYCITFLFLSIDANSQTIPACQDAYVHEKVVTNNKLYEEQGYKLFLTREMFVPSGGFQPITVELNAGQMYIMNFIPFLDASNLKLVILDKDNKTIIKKKGKKNEILTHGFVASYTGVYYVIVSQKVKKVKEVCGGFSIMTKSS